MNNYKEFNDYELLYLVKDGNAEASSILYSKYKVIAELRAKKYYQYGSKRGLDFSDLVQEGMIGLAEAINDYKDEKDIKFSTFASICIERQINSAAMKSNRNKHKILNDSISLDYKKEETDKPLNEYISETKSSNPLDYFVELEKETDLYNKIKSKLTDFENQVLQLKINNFNYKEISEILDKPLKSIDNTLQRIKNKVKELMKSN